MNRSGINKHSTDTIKIPISSIKLDKLWEPNPSPVNTTHKNDGKNTRLNFFNGLSIG